MMPVIEPGKQFEPIATHTNTQGNESNGYQQRGIVQKFVCSLR